MTPLRSIADVLVIAVMTLLMGIVIGIDKLLGGRR